MPANLSYLTAPSAPATTALFIVTALLTAALLGRMVHRAVQPAGLWLAALAAWLLVQAGLAGSGFYAQQLNQLPPRLVVFGIAPTVVVLGLLLAAPRGRQRLHQFSLPALTALSVVRVLVEIGLYLLAQERLVPELMTFAGRNFDIVAGLTAPVVAYAYVRGWLGRRGLLAWHVVGLGLLINIVVLALLAAPTPLQRLAFEQPNVAVLRFPFVWLPVFVVPVVLLTHVMALRQLWGQRVA